MMRLSLAFVVPSFPVTTETFIVNQICDLLDREHQVQIFALAKNTNAVIHQKIFDYGLIEKTIFLKEFTISLPQRYFSFLQFVVKHRQDIDFIKLTSAFNYKIYGRKTINLRNFTKYYWILNNRNFDLIHAHFGHIGAYIAEMKSFGFFSNTPLVTSFHGYDISPHLLNYYQKKYEILFRESKLLTVNSEYTKFLLRQLTGHNRIEILPVGLYTDEFRNKKKQSNSVFSMLFVGRLVPFKGPNLLIEIVKVLVARGFKKIKLSIVGDGVMRSKLKKNIAEGNLQNYIEVMGELPQEEIVDVMANSDVFLLPGIYDENGRAETQGLVLQEAQAMELPVIISDVGGMKYGVVDGETGFVVKEKDLEAFADKIELLIMDPALRKRMGKTGRKFVLQNYDSKVLGHQLESFYFDLISR